jgi:hypothetical protein
MFFRYFENRSFVHDFPTLQDQKCTLIPFKIEKKKPSGLEIMRFLLNIKLHKSQKVLS